MSWSLAIILRPLFLLVVVGLILVPARLAVQRHMRDGRLKRFLLFRLSSAYDTRDGGRRGVVNRHLKPRR